MPLMFYVLHEPILGVKVLHIFHAILQHGPRRINSLVGILADIFVFTYPILLIYWFVTGYFAHSKASDYQSVKIAINTGFVTLCNMVIQYFFFKERPIFSQGEQLTTILKELPTASFPSDHAAVSMMIGLSAVYYGSQTNNIFMKQVGRFRIATSFVMGICRIMTGVHRPTDILAGWMGAYLVFCLIKDSTAIATLTDYLLSIRSYFAMKTNLNKLKSKN